MLSPPRQAKVHRVLLACRCLRHLINQKGLHSLTMKSLMFKALLYCNYTSTNWQLYFYSDVIYLARYHTAIPVFHIFNFPASKSAAKPAPQFYSMKCCSVKRKSPPALRPTALASFPYFEFFPLFFKKSFPYFGSYQSQLIYYLAPPFSKIIYAGALF